MLACNNCGKEIIPGKQFCLHCGTKVAMPEPLKYCMHCGAPIKGNSKFCAVCGKPVSVSAANITPKDTKTVDDKIQNSDNYSYTQPDKQPENVKTAPASFHKPAKKKRSIIGCFFKTILIVLLLAIAGIIAIYYTTDWLDVTDRETNIKNFESEVTINLANTDALAGDLKQHGIQLEILEGTFDQEVKLILSDPVSVPEFDNKRAYQTGAPYEISIDQNTKRLNKPVTVTLKLTEQEVKRLKHPGDLWIGYYNGKRWDYFLPLEVNKENAFVKFETYHFSIFSKAEPTREERINDCAYKAAVNQWAEKDNGALNRQATEQMVNQILSKNMGLNNKSLTQDIVEAIMKENDYAKLLVSYNDNKMDEFGQDLAVLAGKKIFEVVSSESNAKALLGAVTEHSSKIGAGIKIGVAIAEGDLEKAAKELSLEIINTFPLTKTFQTAAEITERQVNRWRDQELEAAYQVFVNGAESDIPFWGYQVEPGNFNEVWSQMRGLETKILDDAIKNYAATHNVDVSQLGQASLDQIREQTKENLRQEFLKRKSQEAKIEALKSENIKLLKEFEDANLLTEGRFGYTDNTSFDFRLERLLRIKDMILKDTKSRIGFSGVDEGGIISAKTVAGLIQLWYSSDNGKQKYEDELIKLGYKKAKKAQQSKSTETSQESEKKSPTAEGKNIPQSNQPKTNEVAPKAKAPFASNFNLKFKVFVYSSYTDGYKDNKQQFFKSDFRCYENKGTDGIEISTGNSFSGRVKNDYIDCWIEGERNDDRILWLKYHSKETSRSHDMNSNVTTLNREIYTDIEIRNIPLDPSFGKGDYGINYSLEGWDFDKETPNPQFKKSIVNLEQRIVFYPSKKEVTIDHIDYEKSEVKTRKQVTAIGSTYSFRPGIEIYVYFNNDK